MKKLFAFLLFIPSSYFLYSQSLQEAKKRMYHEQYKSASDQLRNAITLDPKNTEAWYLLTRCYLQDGKINSFWDSLPAIPPALENSVYIECAKGDVLLQHGKKDSAAGYFNAALNQTRQKDPNILLAVAIAHIRSDSGNASYALELLNKAIKLDKKNPAYFVELGNAYRKLQNGTEAYKAYSKALDIDKSDAEAPYRLGKLFVTQNNPDMYLKYFQQAVAIDSGYAPSWYALYYYYYFKNASQALFYLDKYIAVSDYDPGNNYKKADLLYLSKNYPEAIRVAKQLENGQSTNLDPRIYKLEAYSYYELNDSLKALEKMKSYFSSQADSSFVAKDYESMANMYNRFSGKEDSAVYYLNKAILLEKDSVSKLKEYKMMAGLYKKLNDYSNQSLWLGRYYHSSTQAGNVDLFNWGVATYLAKDYPAADSIFTSYAEKYPEQTFGYYWKARSEIAIDTSMELGLAVPSYLKVISLSEADSAGTANKKWLIESYGYLAAYKANTEKKYSEAMDYLEKLLVIEPNNPNAKRYVEILKKNNSKTPVSKNK